VRVVIAEDSVLLREGTSRLLEESGFEVAGKAGDAEDLLRKVGAHEAYALELLSETTESTGYLLKDRVADVESFVDALRRVANGGSALDPEVVALLLGRRRREDPVAALTPREREVMALMAEGRSNLSMAEALVVSERAIEKHVTSIFSKLNLPPAAQDHRRVLAVLAFLRSA
jgi:DNA-binding NarL/FixJ family response regulator